MPARMHADEVDTDATLVRRLLARQFPRWADLPIERVESAGTDNAIYRLGTEMCVRLPRIQWAKGQIEKERRWLPKIAPHLPLAVPVQLASGSPADGYPWEWGVYRWLAGENLLLDDIADPVEAARTLARFIAALQQIAIADAPLAAAHPRLRGAALASKDGSTRDAIAKLEGVYDVGAVLDVWDAALRAPEWDRAPVWFHGDMLPGNFLFEQGPAARGHRLQRTRCRRSGLRPGLALAGTRCRRPRSSSRTTGTPIQ